MTKISYMLKMKSMDANRYATKKTIAQGMLDIALLTANASQLKYILQVGEQHQFYKLMLILISLSIVLQVAAGVLLVVQSLVSIAESKDRSLLFTINHFVDAFIFLSVFCDIMKMNFGLDPAVPFKNNDVEVLKT
ncbi:ninjurin-A isoform X3 [Drosophila sulfurigaster albostrigata]|uniref:ninjurin-A isoform X3 n=1 Tax=Drosophila sulfurigaster albostrigata TaxID=89887 RepID=UPI002D21AD05|nr:ninjurin-A isoform X3 [Drosophila sulfurigaster albostrigata]